MKSTFSGLTILSLTVRVSPLV